ncbi:MAG: methylmalonyl Co-A mutase-associated GTPase MeaB [Actinomycetales bacterium]
MDAAELLVAARTGDRRAVGRLLSLTERAGTDPGGEAAAALAAVLAGTPGRPARVIGLTGPPGAGKSTLAGALLVALRERGGRVWVLAVDPTSPVTGGALLGDRVRMAAAGDSGVVVRSLAARGAGGGVAAAVPWALRVAAALGADEVIVETVGAGQADVAVAGIADVTVLAVPPGLGDEVQALKAGIAELADVVCVTKGDRPDAAAAAAQWRASLGGVAGAPPVVVVTAVAGDVAELLAVLDTTSAGSRVRRADPALARALAAARRAATRGRVTDVLVHLGEALRLGHRPGGPEPVTAADLAAAGASGRGLAALVETVAARLAAEDETGL